MRKTAKKVNRFTIKKTSLGVASVAVASLLYWNGLTIHAQAAEAPSVDATVLNDAESQSNDKNQITLRPVASTSQTPTQTTLNEATTAADRTALVNARQALLDAIKAAQASGITVEQATPQVTVADQATKDWVTATTTDYQTQAAALQEQLENTQAALAKWEQERQAQAEKFNPNQAIEATDKAYVENSFEYHNDAETVQAAYVKVVDGQEVEQPIPLTDANFNVLADQSGKPRDFMENNPVRLQVNDVTADTKLRIKWTKVLTDANTKRSYDMVIELSDPIIDQRFAGANTKGFYEIFRDPANGIVFDRITALKLTKYLVETGTDKVYEGEDYFTQDTLNRQVPIDGLDSLKARAEFVKPIDGSLAAFIPSGSQIIPTPQDISQGNSGAKQLIEKINATRPADQQLSETVYYSKGFDKYIANAEAIVFLTQGKASFILGVVNPNTQGDPDDIQTANPADPDHPNMVWKDYTQIGFGILDKSKFVSYDKPTLTYHEDLLQTSETVTASRQINYQYEGPKANEPTLPPSVTQEADFTRTVTIDYARVLQGDPGVAATPWQTAVASLPAQKVPVIDGYHADQKQVAEIATSVVKINDAGQVSGLSNVTVTYRPNGKIVPVDPEGHEIPGVDRPSYSTDPKDPTKVTPNQSVPDVPGYVPREETVTPEDPTKDTEVIYVKKEAGFTVRYLDQDQDNKEIDSQSVNGKYGDKVTYSTADELKALSDQGYVLVDDGYTSKVGGELGDGNNGKTYDVIVKRGTQTVTPKAPQKPGTPINPNDPEGPKWPVEVGDVQRTATQTVHYQGAGKDTPADRTQTAENVFTRTVTVDKVTGEVTSTTAWTPTDHTFGAEATPVVAGHTADQAMAGTQTATPDNLNVTDTVTYRPNGKIVPVDPEGHEIPGVDRPSYSTDPKDPTKVTPNQSVPDVPGYVPLEDTVTPDDPTQDTEVTYVKKDASFTVRYLDQDQDNIEIDSQSVNGKYGDQITYRTADELKALSDQGYVLVDDGYTKQVGSELGDGNNGKTYDVIVKHGTQTVTPDDPQEPGTPINPNDPEGPKWPVEVGDVQRTATQTVHYQGAGAKTPADRTQTAENVFTRTVTVDKVTGEVTSTTAWTPTDHTFGAEATPVVAGYTADKATAGTQTATPDNLNVTDTVTYRPNGKIVPVDPEGHEIPGVDRPSYSTDPKDPTKVTPDQSVPDVLGYAPLEKTVTPEDPTKDTEVTYVKKDAGFTVRYLDQDNGNKEIDSQSVNGKYGDQITYRTADELKALSDQGYVLVDDGYTNQVGGELGDGNNGKTYDVIVKHGTQTVTPAAPQEPGTPINPNDPEGPKWPAEAGDVQRTLTQTVHYQGAGAETPADKIQSVTFARKIVVDKVTGEVRSDSWSPEVFGFSSESTPKIAGYRADREEAGGKTVTPLALSYREVVSYTPMAANASITPKDPANRVVPPSKVAVDPTEDDHETPLPEGSLVPTVQPLKPEAPVDSANDNPLTPELITPGVLSTDSKEGPTRFGKANAATLKENGDSKQAKPQQLPQTGAKSTVLLNLLGTLTLLVGWFNRPRRENKR
ncbi:mucin-binding protein [Limosilactobacillus ingluviei]|uniref:mucin-binding protein n=1 Tax=Limosilactobacillus ingluviei TaxID=148604 RepID=UPI0003087F9D|nr:YSIRK-type signal peptide-containing protein [Limosilactobacillus ingluviei]